MLHCCAVAPSAPVVQRSTDLRLGERLAVVEHLEPRELLGVLLDQGDQPAQHRLLVAGIQPRPAPVGERARRARDRPVDDARGRGGNDCELLLGRRLLDDEGLGAVEDLEAAVDERA